VTKVTIIAENPDSPNGTFRATAGGHETVGRTAGAALDALAEKLDETQTNTLIVVQNMRPDEFFTAAQQQRLTGLLAKRREALDAGRQMDPGDATELESLVDAELDGTARRAAAMIAEIRA
jgi:hypothetical protein